VDLRGLEPLRTGAEDERIEGESEEEKGRRKGALPPDL